MIKTHSVQGAPAAIGPYSHAASHVSGDRRLVFCSGQTPIDPDTGLLVGEEIGAQTERVFDNLAIVLEGIGGSLQEVIKTTVFLACMDDFAGMNAVYARRFGEHRPARTTVAVRANPLNALVEIECIAECSAQLSVVVPDEQSTARSVGARMA